MASIMTNSFSVTTEVVSVNDTSGNKYFDFIGELYERYVKITIGKVLFLSLLMIIGVIGNVPALYIYAFKYPKMNFRIYILFLAVLDVGACSICIPFAIATTLIMCESVAVCTFMGFLLYFNSVASALILLVITGDRYRRICWPFRKQIDECTAKIACSTALLLALLITWPAPVLYWTDLRFEVKHRYYKYFYIFLIFCALVAFVSLTVLYFLIGLQLWKHGKARLKLMHPAIQGTVPVIELASRSNSVSRAANVPDSGLSSNVYVNKTAPGNTDLSTRMKDMASNNQKTQKLKDGKTTEINNETRINSQMNKTRRRTLIFFIITVVFIVSFAPHLAIVITWYAVPQRSRTFAEAFLIGIMYWSVFINNVTNPIVYGFCDPRFRREVRSMYIKLFCKRLNAPVVC